jgi:hypothetical protein
MVRHFLQLPPFAKGGWRGIFMRGGDNISVS